MASLARCCLAAVALMAAAAPAALPGEEAPTEPRRVEESPFETATVRGVVTFGRGGDRFAFIKTDEGRGVRLWLVPGCRVRLGSYVEATGLVTQCKPTFRMENVVAHKLRDAPEVHHIPTTLTALNRPPVKGDKSRPDFFGMPVDVVARVQDVNRRRTQVQLFLREPDDSGPGVTASFPLDENRPLDPDLRRGAIVRIRGVPSMDYLESPDGTYAGVTALTLNIVGFWEVTVLNRPSWWTTGRIWAAAGMALFVLAVLVASVVALGWAVRRQTARLERTIQAKHQERIAAEAARRERLRLSHDLHDEFQQLLTGTMFQLNAGMNILEHPEPPEDGGGEESVAAALKHLESARVALQHTQLGLRNVLWTMREESEGPASLVALFRYAAGRMPHWKGRVSFIQTGREHFLARKVSGSLLMLLQEAVANALKHARAGRVDVTLAYGDDGLEMRIVNNGLPFSEDQAEDVPGHFGLAGMRMRTADLGGRFDIRCGDGGTGAVIKVWIPYTQKEG